MGKGDVACIIYSPRDNLAISKEEKPPPSRETKRILFFLTAIIEKTFPSLTRPRFPPQTYDGTGEII
jgi:hypothetical protein